MRRRPREAARTAISRALGLALLAFGLPSRASAQDPPGVPLLEEIRIALPETQRTAPSRPAPPPASGSNHASPATGSAPATPPSAELARCRVLVWITADGTIRAGQVIGSTGVGRLDDACTHGLVGRHVEPSFVEGRAIDSWAIIPLVWTGARGPLVRGSPAPVPMLASAQALHLQPPFYPTGALARHEQGDCTMHVSVSAQGHLEDLSITHSTGSPDLDAGCLAVIYAAHFTPAQRGTQAVAAATDVVLHWQLPP